MDRAVFTHREVLERNVGRGRARELLLGLLSGFLEAVQCDAILREVHAVLVLDLAHEVVDDALVPVVATEAVVTRGRHDLNGRAVLILRDLEEGDIERAATEVEHEDALVVLALFEAVRESGRGGLVDDAQDVEARDLAGVLRGLAFRVVEVGGNGDDRVGHGLAEVGLSIALELAEGSGRDLLRGVFLVVDFGRPVGAHVALDRRVGTVDVGRGLALSDFTDEDFAGLREGHNRGGRASTFGVRDNGGFATFENGDNRVGGAEVDSYCL